MRRARNIVWLLLSLGAVCGCSGVQSVMTPVSDQASRIEALYWVIFWICLAAFVLTMLAFARVSRSRVQTAEPAPVMEDKKGDRRAAVLVGAAIGITFLSVFTVLVLSIITGKKVSGLESKNPVAIEVTGHQWWWEIRYPNSQADQTVLTANEIHVPVGKPVVILTASRDVIHSFWAPNIQGKRDLLPGYQSALWIQVDKPGRYRGQCAEYCGHQHAHMAFEIVAESDEEFALWLAKQRGNAFNPSDPTAQHGRDVFLNHACVMCHTIRGTGAASKVGPDLTHLASRRMIAAGTLPNTPGALGGWITDPQNIKPGNRMPPNPMQPDDLQALISYLRTLQ